MTLKDIITNLTELSGLLKHEDHNTYAGILDSNITDLKQLPEPSSEIARNHPVFFKSGNINSADIVRGEIDEAIEKSREA